MTKAKRLRGFFNDRKMVYVMGAHSGLSAKLVEKNGFDAIWASGLEVSAAAAVPDANILTMTQFLDKSSEMNEAAGLPVISDCDTGYGNSSNVIHMVRKYEAAGIAAVCIEDKLFPKMNSFIPGRQELATIAEFVGKIMAAKGAQASPDFMVIARTEALIAGWGEEEALLRAGKYVEAGADAILIHSKSREPEEIVSFARKWGGRAPLVIVPTTYPRIMRDFTDEELLDLGIHAVIFANQGLRAAIKAMDEVMASIRQARGSCQEEDRLASLADVFDLQGMTQLKDSEKKYLKSGADNTRAILLAAGSPHNQEDLTPLLRDRPVALLDINGKSLIERDIQTLAQAGISDISVVAGYHAEQFSLERVRLIKNPEYDRRGILHSLMLAQENASKRTLVAFADILFDRALLERLLKSDGDVVLAVDATFRRWNRHDKKLDLVVTDPPPQPAYRTIGGDRPLKVTRIGDGIPESEAHYEFVGVALFSEAGMRSFREVCEDMSASHKKREGSPEMPRTLNEVWQEMIDRRLTVSALEVNSGWMEIHTFENYRAACSMLSQGD